jgi:hypothetical protein
MMARETGAFTEAWPVHSGFGEFRGNAQDDPSLRSAAIALSRNENTIIWSPTRSSIHRRRRWTGGLSPLTRSPQQAIAIKLGYFSKLYSGNAFPDRPGYAGHRAEDCRVLGAHFTVGPKARGTNLCLAL